MSLPNISAEAVACNRDVLLEILVRLPVKPLTKFKMVSKQWCAYISDQKFVHRHSLRHPNKISTGLFLFEVKEDGPRANEINFVSMGNADPSSTIPSFTFLKDVGKRAHIKIWQSCNGLFLCRVTTLSSRNLKWHNYCVCNPTTKKYRVILKVREGESHDVILVFDPSVSPYYKVVMRNDNFCPNEYCLIDIYSSEDQSTRHKTYRCQPPNNGLYLYGGICWIDIKQVVVLDVYTEKMGLLPMPPNNQFYIFSYLPGSGGRLYRTDILGSPVDSFPVYEIKSNFSKWVAKHDISVGPMVTLFPQIARIDDMSYSYTGTVTYELAPLCIVEGLCDEDSALVLAIPGKIISYNLMHKTVKELSDYHGYPTDSMSVSSVRAFEFIESLCFV